MEIEKGVYTLDEVAGMLKVTKRTLYNYIRAGKLKAVKIGKYWRVTSAAIEELFTRGATA